MSLQTKKTIQQIINLYKSGLISKSEAYHRIAETYSTETH